MKAKLVDYLVWDFGYRLNLNSKSYSIPHRLLIFFVSFTPAAYTYCRFVLHFLYVFISYWLSWNSRFSMSYPFYTKSTLWKSVWLWFWVSSSVCLRLLRSWVCGWLMTVYSLFHLCSSTISSSRIDFEI